MEEVNIKSWYTTRQLKKPPIHFVKCSTPITSQSYAWIRNSLTGRFSLQAELNSDSHTFSLIPSSSQYPYFEDSVDAMMYELRWSGRK